MGDDVGESTERALETSVQPYARYRFECVSCGLQGQLFDTAGGAYSEGLLHEHSCHDRVFTTQEVCTRYQYRFECASCSVQGTLFDTAGEAYSEGLLHEHSSHDRVFTTQEIRS